MTPTDDKIRVLRTEAETGYQDLFGRLRGSLPGDIGVRETALAGFAERGLPHRRVEEFKYTDLRAMMREAPPFATEPGPADLAIAFNYGRAFADIGAARLTIVNGHVASALGEGATLPPGIEFTRLNEALATGHPLLAAIGTNRLARDNPVFQLNTAFMNDGAVLRVPAGTAPGQPLHLRFLNSGPSAFATATRVLVVVEDGASVTIVESHEGPDGVAYQANTVVEFVVGDKAVVNHVRLNAEGRQAFALSTLTATVGADTRFASLSATIGAAVSRHQVFVTFAGENTTGRIDGIGMLNGKQHADTTLVVDHAVPHCVSREMHKTILDDETVGVFQGKIIVRPGAQKTDGGMKSDALLLSESATMNNKPELEIFADDVVCGHGATCGALDDELLFYLRSRGLPRPEAEKLLLQAFLGQALETIGQEGVRDALIDVAAGWLGARCETPVATA